jgi:UDP-sulfoquinovose synthase
LRIAILGVNGYIGWPLALHMIRLGHEVSGFDNDSKSKRMARLGAISAIPIQPIEKRAKMLRNAGAEIVLGNMLQKEDLFRYLRDSRPEVIYNLAQIPSAPYSQIGVEEADETIMINTIGANHLLHAMRDLQLDAHLITLGTMGEYGTPELPIPEGFFDVEYRGKKATMPFPRNPGSIYHSSKVFTSVLSSLVARLWGLRISDVMQGVVYGTRTDELNSVLVSTCFAFDECFGTAINRFCAQAVIGMPLTPYGAGGQTRGFLSLTDSIQCLSLIAEHPPEAGKYEVYNQLDQTHSIIDLAHLIVDAAGKCGIEAIVDKAVRNPRKEAESHSYEVDHEKLPAIGFIPTKRIEDELVDMITDLIPWKDRILTRKDKILPKTTWSEGRKLEIAKPI